MRFAFVENRFTEAETGLRGICRGCGARVIAKCGETRIHHWAHQSNKMCDSWWEPETEWHRNWKNNFPLSWQERIMLDEVTGENHISDVRTDHGLVLEFQYSHITAEERNAREKFYKKMVWVVDGTRLKRDYPRFYKWKTITGSTERPGIFKVTSPETCLPADWVVSRVPVIFDFAGLGTLDDPLDIRKPLYCLFPVRVANTATLAEIPRGGFIKNAFSGDLINRMNNEIIKLSKAQREYNQENELRKLQYQIAEQERIQTRKQIATGRRWRL